MLCSATVTPLNSSALKHIILQAFCMDLLCIKIYVLIDTLRQKHFVKSKMSQ